MKPTMTIRISIDNTHSEDLTNITFITWMKDDDVMVVDINWKELYIKSSQIMHIWTN